MDEKSKTISHLIMVEYGAAESGYGSAQSVQIEAGK